MKSVKSPLPCNSRFYQRCVAGTLREAELKVDLPAHLFVSINRQQPLSTVLSNSKPSSAFDVHLGKQIIDQLELDEFDDKDLDELALNEMANTRASSYPRLKLSN